jgi:hypothetical protein
VVQELRSKGMITWTGDVVTILDWAELRKEADFDPTYLYLNREAR